ncbi:MAG: hypothetical protein NC300_02370 [Bacteroidales bacterium]|nr:hypothetical protein [Clostridium sp.]MCM1202969.1 hypothetical protein [Bacteroidales bacterium]
MINETKSSKREKIRKVLIVIMVIWLLKIAICVIIREYQNSNFLWMYQNSQYNSEYDLHIERKFHFFNLKYGILGISYHYTIDVYDTFNLSRMVGIDDMGTFRISFLHYGYIQDYWPLGVRKDSDITARVQDAIE